jgi:DNA repair photolyase
MSIEYSPVTCKTALSPSGLPGLDYSLNPYVGCGHGCLYCYSPATLRNRELIEKWGRVLRAKVNIAEVLEEEVKQKKKGTVGVSTVCDPYQPLEAKLKLTRKCLEILASHGFDVCIQTKSSLVLRDGDLIEPRGFEVGVTIITTDVELSKKLEPGASLPEARVKVLKEFSSRGVSTWIFMGPIIPEINDDEDTVRKIIEIGHRTRSEVLYDKLNLKLGVLDRLAPVLDVLRPGLVRRLPDLVSKKSGWWNETRAKVESISKEYGTKCEPAFPE